MLKRKSFASDNFSGVHPEIINALIKANIGHEKAYGGDIYTKEAIKLFQKHFGENIDAYFVYNGTSANVLGLKAITDSFNSIICTETSHLHMDECGAGENFTGCKLITIPTKDGKMNPKQIKPLLHSIGNEHHSQPKVISITQSTELGTVYSIAEIKNLAKFAHKNNMFLHIDGARISNAVATLNTDFKRMITDTDIDVLSFGGTKNGMMFGEAVIFFNKKLSKDFKYIRKQGMQLSSKMRFISAQFLALLSNDLWLKNAQHSNKMAKLLEKELKKIPRIKITQQVQANAVFALIPKKYIPILQKEYFFYVWDEETSEVRLMCSFDTTKNDIKDFIKTVRKIVK